MSGRFGHALKAVALGALLGGSMLGATAGSAAAHDWDRGRHDHGREWYSPGTERGYDRGRDRDWRDERRHRHGREWREPRVIYAPPPVIYQPRPRVIYAPPPVVYAPAPGFGLSVNIR